MGDETSPRTQHYEKGITSDKLGLIFLSSEEQSRKIQIYFPSLSAATFSTRLRLPLLVAQNYFFLPPPPAPANLISGKNVVLA